MTKAERNKKYREDNPDYDRDRAAKNPEYNREKGRRFRRNNPGYQREYFKNNPQYCRAKDAARNGVKYGRIIKPDHCHVCPETIIEGHHYDMTYDKSNDQSVVWLCPEHHKLADHGRLHILGLKYSGQLKLL